MVIWIYDDRYLYTLWISLRQPGFTRMDGTEGKTLCRQDNPRLWKILVVVC